MDRSFNRKSFRLMKLFSLTFVAGLLGINSQAKTIQLTMQHMEQPPSRVEAMQVVVDKFNAKYPQYRMKQNVVGWGEAYSRVTAQVEAGVGVDLQQAIPAFFTAIRQTGGVQPATGIFNKVAKEVKFIGAYVDQYRADGEIWAIPAFGMLELLMYNKKHFEEAGILRDMIQSHVLQLLTLIAMEPPVAFEANAIRDEKVKVLHAIRPYSQTDVTDHVVRAQYVAKNIDGNAMVGYRQEPEVNPKSTTETFVAMRLDIDNWRWAGVPFYLRVGKRLAKRLTEVAIYFKHAPYALFRSAGCYTLEPNVLALRIQPNEGISLGFGSKAPGTTIRIDPVQMDFLYETSFQDAQPEAYERLLSDCLTGDSTLFARRDEIEHAWDLVTRILHVWNGIPRPQLPEYQSGSWGPDESDDLIRKDLRKWRKL